MPISGFDPELNLVEGLKLKVDHTELAAHCEKRAEHHNKRAEELKAELPRLREVMEALKTQGKQLTLPSSVSSMGKGAAAYAQDRDDPIENLENDIKDHNNKAVVFKWFSTHFMPMGYILDESALRRLEILK